MHTGPAGSGGHGPTDTLLGDRYRVVCQPVAEGSFGKVMVAHDQYSGQLVAIKRQSIDSSSVREWGLYKLLRGRPGGDNVLQLLDDWADGMATSLLYKWPAPAAPLPLEPQRPRQLYFVFEFMDTSLDRLWQSTGGLMDRGTVTSIMAQVSHGLHFLHQCGVVHADLTLSNILVTKSGLTRLADLGLSYHAGLHGPGSPPRRPGFCTAYIRSPEVILGDEKASYPLDIWAYGVATMSLLCGHRVFHPAEQIPAKDTGCSALRDKCIPSAHARHHADAWLLRAQADRIMLGPRARAMFGLAPRCPSCADGLSALESSRLEARC